MKKSVVVLIVILILLVLGMGGYLVYDKVLSKDEVKEERVEKKEEVKENEEEYDHALAKALVEKYLTRDPWYSKDEMEKGLTDDIKLYLAISNTKATNQYFECDKAFDIEVLEGNQKMVKYNNNGIGTCYDVKDIYNHDYYYTYDAVNSTYKNLFGDNQEVPKRLITLGIYRYGYSQNYNAYIWFSCECGGAPTINDYYNVVSAITKGDSLEITIGYLLVQDNGAYNEGTTTIEKYVYNGTKEIYYLETTEHGLNDTQMESVYSKEIDYLPKYKLVFKKHTNSNNYYFVSMDKI